MVIEFFCCATQLRWLRGQALWGLQRELNGVLWSIALPTYTPILIVLIYPDLTLSSRLPVWFLSSSLFIQVFCHGQGDYHKWSLTICDGCKGICKGTSKMVLSQYWESVLLVAQWQYMYAFPSFLSSLCLCHVVQCLLFIIRTLWLLIHVLMWWCMWSSSVEVYILASCRRYTSLESQLSFQDYPLAWRVIASEWFPYS